MNSRERVLRTLHHEEPDFVPLTDHIYMMKSLERILGEPGVSTETPEKYVKVHRILGLDVICEWTSTMGKQGILQPPPGVKDGEALIDEWKVKWKAKSGMLWYMGGELKEIEEIKEFKSPDADVPQLYSAVKGVIRLAKNDLAIAGIVDGPFTRTWLSTGFQNWVKLSHLEKDVLSHFLDEAMEFSTEIGKRFIEEGVDIIWIGDDYGDIRGPLISPRTFRSLIFPRLENMVNTFKKRGVHVFLHSDGNLMPIFEDLIDAGFDAIHPLERKAGMNIEIIKKKYGAKITLIGNVDSLILQTGPLEKIETQVAECINLAAREGGYILASDHSIHEGVPAEHVKYMFEVAKKLGKYPIDYSLTRVSDIR